MRKGKGQGEGKGAEKQDAPSVVPKKEGGSKRYGRFCTPLKSTSGGNF